MAIAKSVGRASKQLGYSMQAGSYFQDPAFLMPIALSESIFLSPVSFFKTRGG